MEEVCKPPTPGRVEIEKSRLPKAPRTPRSQSAVALGVFPLPAWLQDFALLGGELFILDSSCNPVQWTWKTGDFLVPWSFLCRLGIILFFSISKRTASLIITPPFNSGNPAWANSQALEKGSGIYFCLFSPSIDWRNEERKAPWHTLPNTKSYLR